MTLLAGLLASLALAAAPHGKEAAGTRVAVVSLSAPPNLVHLGKQVAQVVAEAAERAGYRVVGPEAIERQLGRVRTNRLIDCGGAAACATERTSQLRVDRVVSGVLAQTERNYQVTVVLIDTRTGRELTTLSRDIPIATRRLLPDLAAATPALLRGEADAAGTLMVLTDEPGAETVVDGQWTGTTPFVLSVRPGKHEVLVRRSGFIEQDPRWVEVGPKEVLRHRVKLFPIPQRDLPSKGGRTDVQE